MLEDLYYEDKNSIKKIHNGNHDIKNFHISGKFKNDLLRESLSSSSGLYEYWTLMCNSISRGKIKNVVVIESLDTSSFPSISVSIFNFIKKRETLEDLKDRFKKINPDKNSLSIKPSNFFQKMSIHNLFLNIKMVSSISKDLGIQFNGCSDFFKSALSERSFEDQLMFYSLIKDYLYGNNNIRFFTKRGISPFVVSDFLGECIKKNIPSFSILKCNSI